jgi:ADP-glucose pyrophosphorylase
MASTLRPKYLEGYLASLDDAILRENAMETTNTALFDEDMLTEEQKQQFRTIFSLDDRIELKKAIENTSIKKFEKIFLLMYQAFVMDAKILVTALNRNAKEQDRRAFLSGMLQRNLRNQEMLSALRDACHLSREMNLNIPKDKMMTTMTALAQELIEDGIVMEYELSIPLSTMDEAHYAEKIHTLDNNRML